jgi:hypothetical protein
LVLTALRSCRLSASMALVSGMKGARCRCVPRPARIVCVVWVGEYGATVRDVGHPGANAGWQAVHIRCASSAC